MKPPQWLAQVMAEQGDLVLRGKKTRAEADADVAAEVRKHPEYGEGLGVSYALGQFGKWVRKHTSTGDLFQAQMFQGLPATMLIAPQHEKAVADMTGTELDHARNMLRARTRNQLRGTREAVAAELATFEKFYRRFRPHLKDSLTVSDVMGQAVVYAAPEPEEAGQPDWLVLALARLDPQAVAAEIEKHPDYMRGLLVDIASGLHDGLSLDEAAKAATGTAA